MAADRDEVERLLTMAKSQGDPVAIEHFELELLRLDNPKQAERVHAQRIARDRQNWPYDTDD
jgi:hypothetical protein